MSTVKQQKVVENSRKHKTKKSLLLSAGYSENTAIKPSQVLESKGIRELVDLGEAMGLDDKTCINAVIKSIKDQNLANALNAVKYWFGLKYPDSKERANQLNVQINNYDNSPETLISEARELLEANGYIIRKE